MRRQRQATSDKRQEKHWHTFVLVGWYALSGAPLAPMADVVTPKTKVVARADFPCANHGCACRSAEQCRLRCCCHLAKPTRAVQTAHASCHLPRAKPRTVPVTAWAEASCQGRPTEAALHTTLKPHVPPAAHQPPQTASIPVRLAEHATAPRELLARLPDKVPI